MPKDKNTDEKDDGENDLFRDMMTDVTPLPDANRVVHDKPRPAPKRRPQASGPSPSHSSDETGFIAREHVADIAPEERLFFAHPGLQHRETRRLKRGDISIEATLDLHGQTIAEAGALLSHFLNDAQAEGLRCICVVHGKGHRSTEGRPVLKGQVNQWLRDAPPVLAFSSAQARDGGMGALYVLLRRLS
jgi:DNA-nicking Smr family endonuclease